MDVAASIIAIVQIAKTVGDICGSYIGRYRDAPKDLRSIVIEVGSVKSVLEVIQLLHSQSAATNSSLLEQMTGRDGPLPACLSILQELLSLFPKEERVVNGERKMFLGHLERLRWPSKASKAQRLLADLGKLKSTLSLMLTSDVVVDIKEVKTTVHQIQHRLSEKEKEDILKWLVTTNPSPNHNSAVDLREPQTGTWLLRSEEYAKWLTGPVQLFWIHGIPGAGKTVLLSFLALAMQDHCWKDDNVGMASCYYYCYFGRSQDETPHLLRWAISQLCRQSGRVPDEVVQLFKAGTEPVLAALMSAFSAVAQSFTTVFLLVDALDETQDQTRLVSTLSCLAGPGFPNVKVLATSRKEPDIERILQKEQSMSLLNPLVDEDIRLYIHETLTSDDRFSGWRPSLVSAVEDALISGAKGMFRWVACQLDILRRLSTESAIRKALDNLPKTLDETYERILVSIPDFNRDFAKRALQWLSYGAVRGTGDFSCAVLAVAVTMPCQDGNLDLDDQLVDTAKLQDICTCLADIPDEDYNDRGTYCEPNLSHYTVKEFLISDRIQHGPAFEFFTSRKASLILFAETIISFLLHFDTAIIGYVPDPELLSQERFPSPASDDSNRIPLLNLSVFYQYAVVSWPGFLRQLDNESGNHEVVYGLLFRLLDPRRFKFKAFRTSNNSEWGNEIVLPEWIADDENWTVIVLLSLLYIGLPEAAKEWLKRNESLNINNPYVKRDNYYGSDMEQDCPLLLALTRKFVDLIRYCILEGRVDYDGRDEDDMVCPIGLIVGSELHSDDICDLIRLMIVKAEVNPKNVCCTPLQIAVGYTPSRSLDVIQLLLHCGADPNAIGSAEADDSTSHYYSWCNGRSPLKLAREAALRGDDNQEQMSKVIDLLLRFGATLEESPVNSSQLRDGSDEAMEFVSPMEIEDSTEKEQDEELGENGVSSFEFAMDVGEKHQKMVPMGEKDAFDTTPLSGRKRLRMGG